MRTFGVWTCLIVTPASLLASCGTLHQNTPPGRSPGGSTAVQGTAFENARGYLIRQGDSFFFIRDDRLFNSGALCLKRSRSRIYLLESPSFLGSPVASLTNSEGYESIQGIEAVVSGTVMARDKRDMETYYDISDFQLLADGVIHGGMVAVGSRSCKGFKS